MFAFLGEEFDNTRLKLLIAIASASRLKKTEENYWVVGLNSSKLFCIVCKSPESFPQV